MYVISVDGDTTTAATILDALTVLVTKLRARLRVGGPVNWSVTEPGGLVHRGWTDLSGELALLEEVLAELDDDLYLALHRAADRAAGATPPWERS